MQIAINAGQKIRLSSRRSVLAGTANVPQSTLPVSRTSESRAQSIKVPRSFFIFRLNGLFELGYSFAGLSLVHQYATKVEVHLAVTRFIFNGPLIFSRGFQKQALPFEEISEIIMSVAVVWIDINRLPKSIFCPLIFFGTQQKYSVVVVGLSRTRIELGGSPIVLLGLLELSQFPIQLDQINMSLHQV